MPNTSQRKCALRHTTEPDLHPPFGMAVRDFTDPEGATWRVWHTQPTTDARMPGYERGWLTFESASGVVRRLTPVPLDWEHVSEVQLSMLCRAAALAPARRSSTAGVEAGGDDPARGAERG